MKHVERLDIAPDHPAYAGHFPGAPILPGVVLLDAALLTMAAAVHFDLAAARISAVKFHAVVRPADQLRGWSHKYAGVPAPSSNRVHCVAWTDYVTQAKVELSNGMRLDLNYYYFPAVPATPLRF